MVAWWTNSKPQCLRHQKLPAGKFSTKFFCYTILSFLSSSEVRASQECLGLLCSSFTGTVPTSYVRLVLCAACIGVHSSKDFQRVHALPLLRPKEFGVPEDRIETVQSTRCMRTRSISCDSANEIECRGKQQDPDPLLIAFSNTEV